MAYFDLFKTNPIPSGKLLRTTIGRATIFQIPPNKLGRGIALTEPCLQENHCQNISPLPFLLPSIINIPLSRPVTLNNLLRQISLLSALLEDGARQARLDYLSSIVLTQPCCILYRGLLISMESVD